MSEDRTKETKDPRSFEERVFARFDIVDQRFDRMEIRITNLEDRQYDTRPIWERALAEIAETNRAMREGFELLRTDLRSEFQTGFESLRVEMKAEFAAGRHEMDHGLRGVARTVDTLNHNVLEMQTYQRYVDKRLEILETEVK